MLSGFKQITNLKAYIVSVVMFIVGVSFLIVSEKYSFEPGDGWIKSVLSNFGALLIASVSIALLWELFSKRAFLDELLAKTGLAEEIRGVGMVGISLNPVKGADFPKLIRSAERLDMFVCYANTWRAIYEEDLRVLASKKGCRIRLIVPNPDNEEIMKDLANRFNAQQASVMKGRIEQAIKDYIALFSSVGNPNLDFSVWIHDETPVTSFYRFDRFGVVTLYKHAKGRGNAPTLVVERGGELYNYIESEVDSMVKGIDPYKKLARKIYPEEVLPKL